ncbi:MAG: tRNA pseudouridine(38-40) synthase TruA [Planctomycetota bacterium]|nr:tRNA pseudouridine(38-40) synthase TruA [Planctomycetota bacterium]
MELTSSDSQPEAPSIVAGFRNVRLTLAYDGGGFCGWQIQANGPSVQAEVQRAIRQLTGEDVAVYSAGRTDSGVHALGQVTNFFTSSPIPPAKFGAALQSHLPPTIVVLDSREVPAKFHATFSARWKRYRYVIDNSHIALPFLAGYSWWMRRRLDAEAMHDAAQILVGKHDFRSFETDWPNKVTSVRTVFELKVFRQPLCSPWLPCSVARPAVAHSTDDSLIFLEIVADGFLYNMVRSITGTLIEVGRGNRTAADVRRILESQRRANAGMTAPAGGLYMVEVEYDRGWNESVTPPVV